MIEAENIKKGYIHQFEDVNKNPIFPVTVTDAVVDPNTGKTIKVTLDENLEEYNNIFENNEGSPSDLPDPEGSRWAKFNHYERLRGDGLKYEEDLFIDSNDEVKLADRYNTDGMGYVILRKNKTFAEQVTKENTIYEIRYEFNLKGEIITIPNKCILKFNGGYISNGTLEGSFYIDAIPTIIFKDNVTFKNSVYSKAIYVEWFGAIGDGINDDSEAFQKAINFAEINNSTIYLVNGKTYLVNNQIEIHKRVIIEGNNAIIKQNPIEQHNKFIFKVNEGTINSDRNGTTFINLILDCENGIWSEGIRTKIERCTIENSYTAIKVSKGYETIVHNCNLKGKLGKNTIAIDVSTSDCIFSHIVSYGEYYVIKDSSYNEFSYIHAWPIDEEYEGSTFYYNVSAGFSSYIHNCYSDTYQYVLRFKTHINHKQQKVFNCLAAWSNKPEGWLSFLDAETPGYTNYAYLKVDIDLNSLPKTFHLCNIDGIIDNTISRCVIKKDKIVKESNCYIDKCNTYIINGNLHIELTGSVDTNYRQDLVLYIPHVKNYGERPCNAFIKVKDNIYTATILNYNNYDIKIKTNNIFNGNEGNVTYKLIADLAFDPTLYYSI